MRRAQLQLGKRTLKRLDNALDLGLLELQPALVHPRIEAELREPAVTLNRPLVPVLIRVDVREALLIEDKETVVGPDAQFAGFVVVIAFAVAEVAAEVAARLGVSLSSVVDSGNHHSPHENELVRAVQRVEQMIDRVRIRSRGGSHPPGFGKSHVPRGGFLDLGCLAAVRVADGAAMDGILFALLPCAGGVRRAASHVRARWKSRPRMPRSSLPQ